MWGPTLHDDRCKCCWPKGINTADVFLSRVTMVYNFRQDEKVNDLGGDLSQLVYTLPQYSTGHSCLSAQLSVGLLPLHYSTCLTSYLSTIVCSSCGLVL